MKWLFYNLLPIVCVLVAGYLSLCGTPGWYWFLIVAALAAVTPSAEDK